MKRILAVIFTVIFCMTCQAQNTTTLTGTVISESSQVWANGTWVASIVIPGGGGSAKFLDGTTVPPQYSGQLNSSGAFPATTPVVGNVAKIVPTGVTWKYCIYSLTSAPPSCFKQATQGTTFNMGNYATTVISKPFIQAGPMVYAYNASEIHDSQNGNGYVNTISGTTFYWQGGQSGSYVATSSSAVTPSQIQTALQGQTNCNVDNLHWYSPFSGTCTPDTPANITALLATLTGCNIDGSHVFAPFLGQCVLVSQVYPTAGVAISTGTAWGTSGHVNGTLSGTTGFPVSPRTTTNLGVTYFCSTIGDQCSDGGFTYSSGGPGVQTTYLILVPPATGGATDTVMGNVVGNQGVFGQNLLFNGSAWTKPAAGAAASAIRFINVGAGLGFGIHMLGGGDSVSCIDTSCLGLMGIPGNQFFFNPRSSNPTFGTDTIVTINVPVTTDNLAETITTARAATHKVHVDQAAASQSANIYEVQDSTGAVLNGFDHLGALINSASPTWVQTDVTGSRSVNTIVTNGTHNITISGSVQTSGSSNGVIQCLVGPSSPPTLAAWTSEITATVTNGHAAFTCDVPANAFYEVVTSGAVGSTIQSWIQTQK